MPANTWIMAMAEATTRALINASDLPKASRERLLQNHYPDPEQLHNAIQSERAYVAHLRQDNVVQIGGQPPRSPQFSGITTSLDPVIPAVSALLITAVFLAFVIVWARNWAADRARRRKTVDAAWTEGEPEFAPLA